jgi:hypothetical protein
MDSPIKEKDSPKKAMKAFLALLAVAIAGGALFGLVRWREQSRLSSDREIESFNLSSTMKISSPAFEQNGDIPAEYTCDGKDASPPLEFQGIPEGAKSLALVVDDPDAPMGTWVHWTVWNITPDATGSDMGEVPSGGTEGTTSFGRTGWGGPCPPSGTHRYFFKLYALDTVLNLPATAEAGDLEAAMDGHILDKAGLIGLYNRQK